MKLILTLCIVSIIEIIRAETNAGMYVYVKKDTIEKAKGTFWPELTKIISDIKISNEISDEGYKLKDVHLHFLTDSDFIGFDFKEKDNSLSANIKNLIILGDTAFELGAPPLNLTGNFNITVNVQDTSVSISVGSEPKGNGLIPTIDITSIVSNIQNDIKLDIEGSQLSALTDQVNDDQFGLKKPLIDLLNQELGKNTLQKLISDELNNVIKQYVPDFIDIPPQEMAVSTQTKGTVKIYDTGLELPLEGTFFPINGVKTDPKCNPLENTIDHTETGYDIQVIVGECTLKSVANALANGDFTFKYTLDLTTIQIPLEISLDEWDETDMQLQDGSLLVKVAASVFFHIDKKPVIAKANITLNTQFHKEEMYKYQEQSLINETSSKFSQISNLNDNDKIAKYKLIFEVKKVENQTAEGIPKKFLEWLKDGLESIATHLYVDIPKVCILDRICMSNIDVLLKTGNIYAAINLGDK